MLRNQESNFIINLVPEVSEYISYWMSPPKLLRIEGYIMCNLKVISYKYIIKSRIWPKTSMQCSFRHSQDTCFLDRYLGQYLPKEINAMKIYKKIILSQLQKNARNLNDIEIQLMHYRWMQINTNQAIFYSDFSILLTKEKHSAVVQRWSHDSVIMFFPTRIF